MFGAQSPADAGALDPAMQGRQIALCDGKARTKRRDVQQVEHFADGKATLGQLEQMLQSDQQRFSTTLALVGESERNVARVVALKLAEDRADMRCIVVDGRQHDDDITRAQRGICTEAGQQLVMKNLHFSLRTVGHMEAHRAILGGIDRSPLLAGFGQWAQLENVILQLAKQAVWLRLLEKVDATLAEYTAVAAGVIITVEKVDVVTALLAPGSQ